jgi:hypothetical protein
MTSTTPLQRLLGGVVSAALLGLLALTSGDTPAPPAASPLLILLPTMVSMLAPTLPARSQVLSRVKAPVPRVGKRLMPGLTNET